MGNLAGRHQFILNKLKKEGTINVEGLCRELKVSSVTVRKDLQALEDKQLLFRTHGGATLINPYAGDRPAKGKETPRQDEKTCIGTAAAALVQDDDCILIAPGSTTLAFAKVLPAKKGLTVITSALDVALELMKQPGVEVMQLGGSVRKSSSSVAGPYAEQILGDFYCNKLFLGVDGVDPDFGLTTGSAAEAQLGRAMIKASQSTIVLCDSTKFGRRGFSRICGLDGIRQVITDSGVPDDMVRAMEGLGITVTIV